MGNKRKHKRSKKKRYNAGQNVKYYGEQPKQKTKNKFGSIGKISFRKVSPEDIFIIADEVFNNRRYYTVQDLLNDEAQLVEETNLSVLEDLDSNTS